MSHSSVQPLSLSIDAMCKCSHRTPTWTPWHHLSDIVPVVDDDTRNATVVPAEMIMNGDSQTSVWNFNFVNYEKCALVRLWQLPFGFAPTYQLLASLRRDRCSHQVPHRKIPFGLVERACVACHSLCLCNFLCVLLTVNGLTFTGRCRASNTLAVNDFVFIAKFARAQPRLPRNPYLQTHIRSRLILFARDFRLARISFARAHPCSRSSTSGWHRVWHLLRFSSSHKHFLQEKEYSKTVYNEAVCTILNAERKVRWNLKLTT